MNDYLVHHGVLGQRWGVRRFQNPDGTLTALGKERYGTAANYEKYRAARKEKVQKALRTAGNVAKVVVPVAMTLAGHRMTLNLLGKIGQVSMDMYAMKSNDWHRLAAGGTIDPIQNFIEAGTSVLSGKYGNLLDIFLGI